MRGEAESLAAASLGPAIEGVPRCRIEDVGVRRGGIGGGERSLPGAQRGAAVIVHKLGAATEHGEFELLLVERGAVLSGFRDLGPAAAGIDAIGDLARRPGNRQPKPAADEPHEFIGLQIEGRVLIEVQRAAVAEQDLDSPRSRPQSIAGKERHVRRRIIDTSFALQRDRSLHVRDVRGCAPLGLHFFLSSRCWRSKEQK